MRPGGIRQETEPEAQHRPQNRHAHLHLICPSSNTQHNTDTCPSLFFSTPTTFPHPTHDLDQLPSRRRLLVGSNSIRSSRLLSSSSHPRSPGAQSAWRSFRESSTAQSTFFFGLVLSSFSFSATGATDRLPGCTTNATRLLPHSLATSGFPPPQYRSCLCSSPSPRLPQRRESSPATSPATTNSPVLPPPPTPSSRRANPTTTRPSPSPLHLPTAGRRLPTFAATLSRHLVCLRVCRPVPSSPPITHRAPPPRLAVSPIFLSTATAEGTFQVPRLALR